MNGLGLFGRGWLRFREVWESQKTFKIGLVRFLEVGCWIDWMIQAFKIILESIRNVWICSERV